MLDARRFLPVHIVRGALYTVCVYLMTKYDMMVKHVMIKHGVMASQGPTLYPKGIVSEQPERFFVSELIREKIFALYEQEVPYCTQASADTVIVFCFALPLVYIFICICLFVPA